MVKTDKGWSEKWELMILLNKMKELKAAYKKFMKMFFFVYI